MCEHVKKHNEFGELKTLFSQNREEQSDIIQQMKKI